MSYLDEVDAKIVEIFDRGLDDEKLYGEIKTLFHQELIQSFKNGIEVGRAFLINS